MRIAVALYLVAVVARLLVAAMFPDPAYPDSFYYVDVARQLAAGHGFNVDVVWIFAEVGGGIPANPTLPIPSNAHWMPLASLVQVPFIWLLGPTAIRVRAAVRDHRRVLGAARLGDRTGCRRAAMGIDRGRDPGRDADAAVPVHGAARQLLAVPAAGGGLAVACRTCAHRAPAAGRDFALAGLLAGIATLSRNDGVLVLAVLGVAFLWDRVRHRRIPFVAGLASAGLFVLVMAPWYARQLLTFGSLSPSTASGKVLFIRDIGEWNSITTPASLDHLLGMGIIPLLLTRVGRARLRVVHLQRPRVRPGPRPVPGHRRLAATAGRAVRALLRLRDPAVRIQRPGVRRSRPGGHVHPLGGSARPAGIRARARGCRAGGRMGGRAPAGMAGGAGGARVRRRRGGARRRLRLVRRAHRSRRLGDEGRAHAIGGDRSRPRRRPGPRTG